MKTARLVDGLSRGGRGGTQRRGLTEKWGQKDKAEQISLPKSFFHSSARLCVLSGDSSRRELFIMAVIRRITIVCTRRARDG